MTDQILQHIAIYARLSREDDDKPESDSIHNQILKIKAYIREHSDFSQYSSKVYSDDGYTGTNFERPDFKQMIQDIESKKVSVVIVKDLSRLGRNMPKVTELVQDYFPSKKIRFIAIDDNIDKKYYAFDSSEDLLIDMKNMFNGFYPKDISKKVRSSFRAKQSAGQFIGAFACYGYKKDPVDHNHLIIDETVSKNVQKIFALFLAGNGQNTIARLLNEAEIPCPSQYKRLCGSNYCNCNKLNSTTYWTYSSIRNILKNRIYTGCMVQNTHFRQLCKKKAVRLPENEWIIVENTHEAIIDKNTFNTVQKLLRSNTRQTNLMQNTHIFAGLIKCGDCGRAMTKITRKGISSFCCGSYNRYGKSHCSAHNIDESVLSEIVINDLNTILASTHSLKDMIHNELKKSEKSAPVKSEEIAHLEAQLEKLERQKSRAYEDYSEELISKEVLIRYQAKYNDLSEKTRQKIASLLSETEPHRADHDEWIEHLLQTGYIKTLDRETVVEMVHMIYIFADDKIRIIYNFSDELEKWTAASQMVQNR